MRKILIYLFLLPFAVAAQQATELSLLEYYLRVRTSNPIVQQAKLIYARGELALREGRGAFDPKLESTYQSKQFKGTDYFDIWNSYVKVPTLLNVDFKAGLERNSGIFLNPERNVPTNGLYYAGISVPLGQGLLANNRNIGLKKAKLSELELQLQSTRVLNNVFLDANHAYWYWYESFLKLELTVNNLALVQQRFDGIRQSVINGDNAAIDSVETLIQVQQWANNLRKAEVDYRKSQLLLQNFLWDQEDTVGLTPKVENHSLQRDLSHFLEFANSNHPDIRLLAVNNSVLDLDRRLAAEQLKPRLDLEYNVLVADQTPSEDHVFFRNNYKAGLNFSYPLLLRKERAKLKTTKLKRNEGDLKLSQKRREIQNKIRAEYVKIQQLQEMIAEQESMVENYTFMLNGEQTKFDNGESSIFLINSRENKKLEAEVKLIELKAELGRSIGRLQWVSGILSNIVEN